MSPEASYQAAQGMLLAFLGVFYLTDAHEIVTDLLDWAFERFDELMNNDWT